MEPITRIVGVTFKNRQATLSELYKDSKWRNVSLIHTTYDNPETGETEPAIQVRDFKTKKELGWIARTEIHKFANCHAMVAEIGEYKDTMFCNLYTPKTPSNKQYWTARRICEKAGISMPLYDVNAYESIFAMLRASK